LNNGSEKAYLTHLICKNKTTGQALTISTSSSEIELNVSGGYLLINTKTGEKSVQSYTKAGKAETDYLSYLDFAVSEWLILVTGTNEITVTVTPKDESCLVRMVIGSVGLSVCRLCFFAFNQHLFHYAQIKGVQSIILI